MEFFITLELSTGLGFLRAVVVDLEDKLNDFLSNKDFGSSIDEVYVLFICLSPEFKKRAIKMVSVKKNYLEFEIDLPYEKTKNATDSEALTIIAENLSKSLDIINKETFNDILIDFKKDQFIQDINNFIRLNIIELNREKKL